MLTILVFTPKCKAMAKKIGNDLYRFLRYKLKLPINRAKSGIRRPVNFELLGYGFVPSYVKGQKGIYQLVVSAKPWKKLKTKLKEITKKTTPASLSERLARLKSVKRGWVNYFRMASIQQKLKTLDTWLRNRLRYCIWHDCPVGIPLGEETRTEKEKPDSIGYRPKSSLCVE